MENEVECQDCFWTGDTDSLEYAGGQGHCPDCGSHDVCDYENAIAAEDDVAMRLWTESDGPIVRPREPAPGIHISAKEKI